MSALDFIFKADFVSSAFEEFHYGQRDVPNGEAIVATLGMEATF
jgi:hypothetical protein